MHANVNDNRNKVLAVSAEVIPFRIAKMRTVPRDYYADRRRTVKNLNFWKKPLTFVCLLLAVAYAISQLLGRFVHSDSLHTLRYEIKGIHRKLNQVTVTIENLATLQRQLDMKLHSAPPPPPPTTTPKPTRDQKHPAQDHAVVSSLIKETVSQAIATYDADHIGLADFALETAGGAVVSTPGTETYTAGIKPARLFGIPICYPKNSPQEMIKASSLPGECWAFKGDCGSAIIRLLGKVHINSVTLEHIPAAISPVGNINSAPREFSVWGLQCQKDTEGTRLGHFMYNNKKKPVQNFKVQFQSKEAYDHVQIKFHSNYGNPNYTCVYRIRIHGVLAKGSYGLL